MQSNSLGVRKWSTPRSTTSCASGRASTSGSGGPAKSRSPMMTSVGQVTRDASAGVNASDGRRRHAAIASGSLPALRASWTNSRVVRSSGSALLVLERGGQRAGVVVAEHVLADADQHEPAESLGRARGDAQQELRAEREADRVDLTIGERGFERGVEVRVRGRVVGRVGGAVAEQIDRDDGAVGVAEEVDPTGRPPAVLERRAESVHEHDGLISHRRSVRRQKNGRR